jgi:uncharacterized protein YbaA (DUF1428 family)
MRTPLPQLFAHQATRIAVDCDRAAIRDSLVSAKWDSVNTWLGVASAVTAALAAFCIANGAVLLTNTGLTENATTYANVFASACALVSALLAAILTFLAPAGKAANYHHFANKYHSLSERIRAFAVLRCTEDASPDALTAEFKQFLDEKHSIDAEHPVVAERYDRAAVEKMEERAMRDQRIQELEPHPERPRPSDTLLEQN